MLLHFINFWKKTGVNTVILILLAQQIAAKDLCCNH